MDSGPIHAARNQGAHLGRTRLRVLRTDRSTRKIPTQERYLALPPLCTISKEPQAFETVVRDPGSGVIVIFGPWS